MPLTDKGSKILRNMQSEYGGRKGKSVFYASINKGKVTGAEKALHVAKRQRQKRADGGSLGRALPLTGAPGAGALQHTYAGPLHSHVPGRTDKIDLSVKPGAYVIPADVVSSLGEGNTLAGSAVLQAMFGPKALTGNVPEAKGRPSFEARHMERAPEKPGHAMPIEGMHIPGPHAGMMGARGGMMEGGIDPASGKPIDVVVAGGEFIIDPDQIAEKFGSLDHGHRCLDEMVHEVRQRDIKWKQNAPPPKA